MERGEKKYRFENLDLVRLVRETIETYRPHLEASCFTLQCDLPAEALEVKGNADALAQVLVNLISNAVKYTRPRVTPMIDVSVDQIAGEQVVCVRDNGVGFSMKYADKLFGVFQRLHRAEDFEGTGVGLATVQRIVQKHGGRIWAEAELDKGATFYLTLGSTKPANASKAMAMSGETG